MGLQAVPEIFVLALHEKVGFCGKELKGKYILGKTPTIEFVIFFFQIMSNFQK